MQCFYDKKMLSKKLTIKSVTTVNEVILTILRYSKHSNIATVVEKQLKQEKLSANECAAYFHLMRVSLHVYIQWID